MIPILTRELVSLTANGKQSSIENIHLHGYGAAIDIDMPPPAVVCCGRTSRATIRYVHDGPTMWPSSILSSAIAHRVKHFQPPALLQDVFDRVPISLFQRPPQTGQVLVRVLADAHPSPDDDGPDVREVQDPARRHVGDADVVPGCHRLQHPQQLLEQLPASPAPDHGVVLALARRDGRVVEIGLPLSEPLVGEKAAALRKGR